MERELTPILFVGHGSPMNAMEDNQFSQAWDEMGRVLPRPRAILCISAHWETAGTRITAMPKPKTIHDFYGFPRPLYEKQYPAPGDPELAAGIQQALGEQSIKLDNDWGLDHGTWSVLCRMFPQADIPTLQLSLDAYQPAVFHYQLGQKLKYLRRQGILIIGSGNIVHNLGLMAWQETAFDWAQAFDTQLAALIQAGDHQRLIDYNTLGDSAHQAIPTNEHYLPLLYILAMQEKDETPFFFCEKITLGSISMRSFRLG